MARSERERDALRVFVGSVIIDLIATGVLYLLHRQGIVDRDGAVIVLAILVGGTVGPVLALGSTWLVEFGKKHRR